MVHKKGDPPYIYIFLYTKIKERHKSPYIKPRKLLGILRTLIRIPNSLYYPILYQMEEYGLIERVNQQKYKILDSEHEKILENLKFSYW